jgi:hypothetical protein
MTPSSQFSADIVSGQEPHTSYGVSRARQRPQLPRSGSTGSAALSSRRTRTVLSCRRRPRLRFRLLRDITATIRGSPRRPGRLDRNGFYTCPTVGAILREQSFDANEGCQVVHSAFPDCDGMTGWIAGCRQVAFEFHVAYGPLQASPSHFGQLSEPGVESLIGGS